MDTVTWYSVVARQQNLKRFQALVFTLLLWISRPNLVVGAKIYAFSMSGSSIRLNWMGGSSSVWLVVLEHHISEQSSLVVGEQ